MSEPTRPKPGSKSLQPRLTRAPERFIGATAAITKACKTHRVTAQLDKIH